MDMNTLLILLDNVGVLDLLCKIYSTLGDHPANCLQVQESAVRIPYGNSVGQKEFCRLFFPAANTYLYLESITKKYCS